MRTLGFIVLFSAALAAQAQAPSLQALTDAQEKHVAALMERVKATPQYQDWQAADAILRGMRARLAAEKPTGSK